jgi:hypothetical protein
VTAPPTSARPSAGPPGRARVLAFVALCVGAVLLVAVYVTMVAVRRSPTVAASGVVTASTSATRVTRLAEPPARPYLVVSSTEPGETWGRLVLVPAAAPRSGAFITPLSCERSHMAGGYGVCLRQDTTTANYYLEIFDDRFTPRHRVPLTGVPSRTRVSPNGRWAAATVFEHGHSYAEDGFSTRTTIVDTASGRIHGDLEQFRVQRDGRRFSAPDFNFWGVTFAPDSNRFYATLSSGGVNYLVEGQVDSRQARVVRRDVECPSLSPAGTHIVFKHLMRRGAWQLRVLDLQTGEERALSHETRSVDDQVDWLDATHVIYQVVGNGGASIWSLEISNATAPSLLIEHAFSPSVIH